MHHPPFSRINQFMSLIATAMAGGLNMAGALAQVGAYESRGHGRGKQSGKKKGNHCTNWKARLDGRTNGNRECARRMRQIDRGIIAVSA